MRVQHCARRNSRRTERGLRVGSHWIERHMAPVAGPAHSSCRLPVGTQPWYQAWLRFSVFSFASPDLESLYQEYHTSNISLWEMIESAHRLVGGAVFARRYLFSSAALPLPPPFVWLASIHCLLTGAMLPMILLRLEPCAFKSPLMSSCDVPQVILSCRFCHLIRPPFFLIC